MDKTVFMHIYDHSIFFKKWLHHTKGTSILAFTTNYERSQKSFSYFLKLIECAILNAGDDVSVTAIKADKEFTEKVNTLVTNHITRTEMNSYLLSIKLFKQCLLEMIAESGIKERYTIMINVGKVFDVIELTIADVFHVSGLQTLKELFSQMDSNPEGAAIASPATLAKLSKLTQTEYGICELITTNISTKEIADKMNVSVGTVHTHRKRIRKKLNIPSEQSLYSYLRYII